MADVPAIACRGLTKRYGPATALDGFDLDVPAGTIVGLLGPSGSGKTTALRVMAGFEQLDAGTVAIAGRQVADGRAAVPPERRRVGMVFQDYALFPHLTVAENVGYGVARRSARTRRVAELLSLVGLPEAGDRHPHELSGGEQQRVALARALAPEPEVILLDEPFSNLDPPRRDAMRREVKAILVESRATAVFVTHDQEEALAMSDTVAVMRHGRVLQSAAPSDLYHRPADCWVARFLGEAEFLDGRAGDGVVDTAFGRFPVPPGTAGPVEVMIRPESVRVEPAAGAGATVTAGEFYGHDQLLTLQVDGGGRLLARHGPAPVFRPGDRVAFRIDEVVAFPAHGDGHH